MKHINIIGLILILLILKSIDCKSQHIIKGILTDTLVSRRVVEVTPLSKMFEGTISNDFIRFRKLDTIKDGEIKYVIQQKSFVENVFIRLNSDTGTVWKFSYTLTNGVLTYQYPGKNASAGNYNNGDELKIVRCKKGILFYKNGLLIDAYTLVHNNFVMYGEVGIAQSYRSFDNISFTPY
jgi:hypothetical protein